jgi:transketolase
MLASACRLDNVHVIVDCNRFQEWGWAPTGEDPHPAPVADMAAKWRAFGWHVRQCGGHDFAALEQACAAARARPGRPSVILAHTRKGKGVPLIERAPWRFHCETVTEQEHAAIMESLS